MGQACSRTAGAEVISAHLPSKDEKKKGLEPITISSLRTIKTIGSGSYSTVRLAQLPSSKYVAVKVMNKAHILRSKQLEHVFNERRILRLMDSPFVADLIGTTQDERNLYCVMEFVQGGELFRYMIDKELLSAAEARFYLAEISMAITQLHSIRCVYRDLKPENVMLTATGHIKLVDFGFAKILLKGERTYTVCGTPEYLAPEVIEQFGYGCSSDWWQVGVILYEMLAGRTPFSDPSPYILYQNIIVAEVEFPQTGFSPEAVDLITKLLRKDPKRRPSDSEVLSHPFFKGIDWDCVKSLRLSPLFVPSLRGPDDFTYFDDPCDKERTEVLLGEELQRQFQGY